MFVKEDCIYLGRIVRTHGIHGQLVLATELSLTEENKEEPILVDIDGGLVPFFLKKDTGLKVRDTQSYLIAFDHITNKEDAERYINCETYLLTLPTTITDEEFPTETAYLKNYSLYDAKNNFVGKIDEVIDFSGNTLVRLFIDNEEVLIPFTEDHILDWDNSERKIQLSIPKGLLEI